jgi:hypothetical protein
MWACRIAARKDDSRGAQANVVRSPRRHLDQFLGCVGIGNEALSPLAALAAIK